MSGRPSPRQDLRKGWCPGALRPMMARDGLLVRLKITGGIVPARLALALADLAERHGNGLLDLSARANLQLRGVREESLTALLEGLKALELLDDDAGAEAVRNVLSSPLAGLGACPPPRRGGGASREAWGKGQPPLHPFQSMGSNSPDTEARHPPPPPSAIRLPRFTGDNHPDVRPIVAALEHALVASPALRALPAKFGFVVDDGGAPSLAGVTADIRFDWDAAQCAFAVGLGGTAADALALGLVAPETLVERAMALAHRLLAHPGEPRRLGRLIREIGPEAALLWFATNRSPVIPGSAAPKRNDKRRSAAEAIVGFHTFALVPTLGLAVPFGRLDAAMLRAAARLAEAGTGELRLTPWRTILVPHVAPGRPISPRSPTPASSSIPPTRACASPPAPGEPAASAAAPTRTPMPRPWPTSPPPCPATASSCTCPAAPRAAPAPGIPQ